jgi:NAD(P)-dependent dehydrogenase (short-subunit alcohol dehydrogenase family)
MERPLENRTAIITGASQGLGFRIAEKYVDAGASVAICARNPASLDEARKKLLAAARPDQKVIAQTADVSAAADVEAVVGAATAAFGRIDILVNNAGVYGPKGAVEDVDWQEWTRAIEINLYGSIHMCRAVLPHFKARNYGKIVQLSGGGATNPLPRISAYAVAKAGVIRFIETLAEEMRDYAIDANAIAPGALNTSMLEEVLQAGPEKVGADFYARSVEQKRAGGAGLDKGADLAVFLGSAASDGITGKLISALWDPWRSLPAHLDDLRSTDIYTLRRIVPRDRARTWGNDR